MKNLMRMMVASLFLFTACESKISAENEEPAAAITVSNTAELHDAISKLATSGKITLKDGVYKDAQLVVKASGIAGDSIIISAENPGKVEFTGDVKVEMRGEYIVLKDIYFRNGARNPKEWKSHGPGLVAMYGSHNRVTGCLFHRFDVAHSAYITTSLDAQGNVPTHCRIDHCAFVEKTTFDQVINLNNTPKKSEVGEAGVAMYHRIDHCYFSNPMKKGNAGGGIRIGYWRKDFGRCLIDNNLFERQDSEPEIITGKSMENVYYNNTFINCKGTLNFRHGDNQVAINNFFLGTDKLGQYGGVFVWGSGHLIACNYFDLPTTIRSRGGAALYFNPGPKGSEHALAYDITTIRNLFVNTNGYDINLNPLYDRRVEAFGDKAELPHDIRFTENIFYDDKKSKLEAIHDEYNKYADHEWKANYYNRKISGISTTIDGLISKDIKLRFADGRAYIEPSNDFSFGAAAINIKSIEGINMNFARVIQQGITGKPMQRTDVGPTWSKKMPGIYADKAELSKEVAAQFEEISKQ